MSLRFPSFGANGDGSAILAVVVNYMGDRPMQVFLCEPRDDVAESLGVFLAKGGVHVHAVKPGKADVAEMLSGQSSSEGEKALLIAVPQSDDALTVDLIRRIRDKGFTDPIIAVQDQKSTPQIVRLLNAGCDDVLQKPFKGEEVAARLMAISRRLLGHSAPFVQVGPVTAYFDNRDPEIDGRAVRLSAREHAIFTHLAKHAGKVVTKESIYNSVYGMTDRNPYDKVIDVYICKIRKKIEEASGGESYIETVYGRGYKFSVPEKRKSDSVVDAETAKELTLA